MTTTQSRERLLARIEKIARLTESPNEHEATLAAERLQDLLTRHNISMAEIRRDEAIPGEEIDQHSVKVNGWQQVILNAIARANHAQTIEIRRRSNKGRQMYSHTLIIAEPSKAELVVEMFQHITGIIRRVRRPPTVRGRADSRSFYIGVADRVAERIIEQARSLEEDAAVTALMVADDQRVEDYIKETFQNLRDARPPSVRPDAYYAGRAVGGSLSINPEVRG